MPKHKLPPNFHLENGEILMNASLHYETFGDIAKTRDVIWICHAFTGSASVKDWWPSLFIEHGGFIDLKKHTVVCANMLGSCYGSTGPDSINPSTNSIYGNAFPEINNRDIVRSFIHLRTALKIDKIQYLIGGSLGGQQALEWSILEPNIIETQVLIASNAKHSPWGIAFNELQRQAIKLAKTGHKKEERKALALARSIAMLSYRSYTDFERSQSGKTAKGQWKVASYLQYQGEKFNGRFSIQSYRVLSKVMDAHNIEEGRANSLEEILSSIKASTLCIGFDNDQLFPLREQELLAKNIPDAKLEIITSIKGHDAFLIEGNQISQYINKHLSTTTHETS